MRSAPELDRPADATAEASLLVLATSAVGMVAIDLGSGAIVRAVLPGGRPRPLDVLKAVVAPAAPEPTQPERVLLAGRIEATGRMAPRKAERWIRPLLHPEASHLLGFAGPAVPFWQLDGSHPSAAVVPARGEAGRSRDGMPVWRFLWRRLVHELPLVADAAPPSGNRIVVALTEPIDGHCHKVVAGIL